MKSAFIRGPIQSVNHVCEKICSEIIYLQSLTTLTNEQIVAELGWTRKAIKAALGVTPTTMRPPKGDIGQHFSSWFAGLLILTSLSADDRVRAISLAMGMVPVLWTSTSDGGKFDSFGTMVV